MAVNKPDEQVMLLEPDHRRDPYGRTSCRKAPAVVTSVNGFRGMSKPFRWWTASARHLQRQTLSCERPQEMRNTSKPILSPQARLSRAITVMAALMWSGWSAVASEPDPAQVKAEANAHFKSTSRYMFFIATDKGTRGYDNTSVRMGRDNYIKSVSQDGCRLTIAHDRASLGDPRNGTHREGAATITIDWGLIVEIDDTHLHADPYETGFLLRGGIETSVGTRPALRILGSFGNKWAFYAEQLQRICRKNASSAR